MGLLDTLRSRVGGWARSSWASFTSFTLDARNLLKFLRDPYGYTTSRVVGDVWKTVIASLVVAALAVGVTVIGWFVLKYTLWAILEIGAFAWTFM
jgi:hypothetical protein